MANHGRAKACGKLAATALLGAIALSACNRQPQPSPPLTPNVSVVKIEPREIALTTQLPGRTSSYRIAEIRPQVNGLIQKRLFTEGADVKAGQPLYQIDPAPFQAALENARASLARAEANLPAVKARAERFGELVAGKAISRQDYDDATSALKQVEADIASWKAQVESARINLAYTRIVAPINGRIGKSGVSEGAIVTAYQSTPLAAIQQLNPIYVDVPQSTSDLLRLKKRMAEGSLRHDDANRNKVALTLEDGSRYAESGSLQFRDVTVDPSTGSVTLRMVFPNAKGVLLPEMFVRAEVREGVHDQAILVPQQGVMRNAKGEPYVMVVDGESKVGMRTLSLEREIGDQWLVTAGLTVGDRVIVEGLQTLQRLRPGSLVTVNAEPFQAGTSALGGQLPSAK